MLKRLALLSWILGFVPPARAVEIFDHVPSAVHANEGYVIFSHGLIAEGTDPKPLSPQFGLYDFPAIKQGLFEGGNFNLIAIQRPKDVEFDTHVANLVSLVQRLLGAGVKPSRITLVGFSRGGQLTAVASSHLADKGINTAVIAICMDGDFSVDAPLSLGGNFLSVYETSDELKSCSKLAKHSHLTAFKEVSISTGKGHGAFFEPRSEWVRPLKEWIAKTNH